MERYELAQPKIVLRGTGRRHVLTDHLSVSGDLLIVHSRSSALFLPDLEAQCCGRQVHKICVQGEPTLTGLRTALSQCADSNIRMVIAMGGGSVIDMGKALSALIPAGVDPMVHLEVVGQGSPLTQNPLPFIAIPTTAGTGAESTKNAVIKVEEHHVKVSLRDARMIPDVVILDPELSQNMPWNVTFMTGMDAVTQVIEPFLSCRSTPIVDQMCLEALERGILALHRLKDDPSHMEARADMLETAFQSGVALANTGLGIVHGLAAVLGGVTDAPHGAICARLLPSALRVNRQACQSDPALCEKFSILDRLFSDVFGAKCAAEHHLERFIEDQSFAAVPIFDDPAQRRDIIAAAENASSTKGNPVKLSAAQIDDVLAGIVT